MATSIFRTQTPGETQNIGEEIGKQLRQGDLVALIGDLGTGKTCLTQGIARGVGVYSNQIVNSPSYTLINEYAGKIPIYHVDLYRLQNHDEILDLGLDEYLKGNGICIIEWADKLGSLQIDHTRIQITWLSEMTREIEIQIP
ncbi:TPA: tRNA (adenosine(37)-N6)-threonylcarbamoyltransferase complex ATPase subunit type 1 TsaE [Candidatus Poribacteria bacterium]|jgi:tRNA threonylcarbamoyladenosine biosynthesis protein TsaE|nr:tRNA (adenosine(37)-N6)-threonylcarbamoyltransferase complex ATPase subunit type 1 TsaE [Candidatus Poribacteria bacterium]HIB87579.1 tRNA (adenosine(37)-N6)-threonylcarbamoyltransferase complex ATPase subunit type 1 TsaE [Candidatus Poribacteria bacterium]HIC02450.1 tRNA (adenosine(37)-N6)-threonylcarbamoyltransferase complex ATPase subunit type 1 TsaE [Candidatus Poribacteria bacterium]HIM09681.1 tRNA (adenosine(37)-N6)-threonylcarbamoyltransferase complex ATPase subunit type 1 TsaE [Candid